MIEDFSSRNLFIIVFPFAGSLVQTFSTEPVGETSTIETISIILILMISSSRKNPRVPIVNTIHARGITVRLCEESA